MSIVNNLNENDVINSIRLQSRHPLGANKVWILVEGDVDSRLLSKLINGEDAKIEISLGGVTKLLEVVGILNLENICAIGIRDADFAHLLGATYGERIFLTDFHDMEMMLIHCDNAYFSIAAEYNGDIESGLLRNKILELISFIGCAKYINYTEHIKLDFKGLGLGSFCDFNAWMIDKEKYLLILMQRSTNKTRSVSLTEIENKVVELTDLNNLCSGHDFQKVYSLYIGSKIRHGVKEEVISKAFRIAYRVEDFKNTGLYGKLKIWADQNSKQLFR